MYVDTCARLYVVTCARLYVPTTTLTSARLYIRFEWLSSMFWHVLSNNTMITVANTISLNTGNLVELAQACVFIRSRARVRMHSGVRAFVFAHAWAISYALIYGNVRALVYVCSCARVYNLFNCVVKIQKSTNRMMRTVAKTITLNTEN